MQFHQNVLFQYILQFFDREIVKVDFSRNFTVFILPQLVKFSILEIFPAAYSSVAILEIFLCRQ